jgi:hypothetical protein
MTAARKTAERTDGEYAERIIIRSFRKEFFIA